MDAEKISINNYNLSQSAARFKAGDKSNSKESDEFNYKLNSTLDNKYAGYSSIFHIFLPNNPIMALACRCLLRLGLGFVLLRRRGLGIWF